MHMLLDNNCDQYQNLLSIHNNGICRPVYFDDGNYYPNQDINQVNLFDFLSSLHKIQTDKVTMKCLSHMFLFTKKSNQVNLSHTSNV